MSFLVIERKSPAAAVRSLKVHLPRVAVATATTPLQTFGSVTPATGVSVTSALGNGACGLRTKLPAFHDTARTVRPVTVMVLPRVQLGNLEGERLRRSV